jgi:hypothetical protein
VTRRIGLLIALVAAPIIVVLGSMLAGRYYFYSKNAPPEPPEERGRGSITVWPPGSTGSFMSLDGVLYDSEPVGRPLNDDDLGPKFADVHRETAPDVNKAVPVYAVEGYDTSFRLAARVGDRVVPFEAFANPKADEASDILDIGGKVRSISVLGGDAADIELDLDKADDLVIGTIGDPEEANRLVRGLMDAPLKPTPIGNYYANVDHRYVIVFRLEDGTAVAMDYRTDTGRLANTYSTYGSGDPPLTSGIVTPPAFRDAIKEPVREQIEEFAGPPESTLSYGGREVISSPQPSYCWGGGCFDGLPGAPPRNETLYVPSGSEMVFHYESQSPPNKVTATAARPYEGPSPYKLTRGPKRSLEVHGSGVERAIAAKLPPGEYLVFVGITAPPGEVSYIFRVVVQ